MKKPSYLPVFWQDWHDWHFLEVLFYITMLPLLFWLGELQPGALESRQTLPFDGGDDGFSHKLESLWPFPDVFFPMILHAFSHGFLMIFRGFLLVFNDFPMIFHGFSHISFSWFFMVLHVFPMVLPIFKTFTGRLYVEGLPGKLRRPDLKNSCRRSSSLSSTVSFEYPRFMATCIYVAASTVWVKLMKFIFPSVGRKCHQRCDQCSSVLAQDGERRRDAPWRCRFVAMLLW